MSNDVVAPETSLAAMAPLYCPVCAAIMLPDATWRAPEHDEPTGLPCDGEGLFLVPHVGPPPPCGGWADGG